MNKIFGFAFLCGVILSVNLLHAKEMALGAAMQAKHVVVSARSHKGHSAIKVNIKNVSDENLTVDVLGSLFDSGQTRYQRLGVPRLALDGTRSKLSLAPGQAIFFSAPAFCMDRARATPPAEVSYILSPHRVSASVRKAFSFWNRHPTIPQSDVQSAVWNGTKLKPVKVEVPTYEELVLANGMDYVRLSTGVLQMRDLSSRVKAVETIGRGIVKILPCSNGMVAIKEGAGRGYIAQTHTGSEWKTLATISQVPTFAACLSNGNYLFIAGRKLLLRDRRTMRLSWNITQFQEGVMNGKRMASALSSKGELINICMKTGRMKRSTGAYDAIGWGMNFRVLQKGLRVWVQRSNGNSLSFQLKHGDSTLMVSGVETLVRNGHRIWRMEAGSPQFIADLGSDVKALALNASYGAVHVLKKGGVIDIVKLDADEDSTFE